MALKVVYFKTLFHFQNSILSLSFFFSCLNFRLKIGAKSKKDPHIRVGGRTEESVMRAKMMITEVLDTTTNSRVTMKMDVSYTDHSHIIGKGGNTIRRVMAETNCHIHFPDSNRSNPNEKSNQVLSI